MTENFIYNEDCIEVMGGASDESVDLIVTDPPYLMSYQSGWRTKTEKFNKIIGDIDSYKLISDYIKECYRILKNDSAIYIFCSWHHIDFFKQEIEKYFKLKNIIVWNKNNHGSGDLTGSYAPKHEFILYAVKGRCLNRGKRIADVINCDKIPGTKMLHPTQKPIDLLKIFINQSSDEDDVVFDGFIGVGSTAMAAIELGRKYIGCELDERYYQIAASKLDIYKNTLQ